MGRVFLLYLAIISSISFFVCVYDKVISKKDRVELRIPEKSLLMLAALGGSAVMFVAMILIRHKTRHMKFMIGIPLIILLQVIAIWTLLHFGVITV